jgi:hypothetical protein
MKAEQERLKYLLTETVKEFLNDSVKCHNVLSVEGLIGITLNNEVFLVYVNESCTGMVRGNVANCDTCSGENSEGSDVMWNECDTSW